jgi:hypothetical protein
MSREPQDNDAYEDLGGRPRSYQVDEQGARIPRGAPSRAQQGLLEDGAREPRPAKETPAVQLVTEDLVEEDIASMCRIWGVYVTSGVLGQYRETLLGLPPAAIHAAVKQWIRQPPADRHARPHELRALAEKQAGQVASDRAAEVEGRRTEPPPPRPALDVILAELAAENPNNPLYQVIISRRQRAKAEGEPLNAEQTATMLSGQMILGHVYMGHGEVAHQPGTYEDWRSTNAPTDEHL